MGGLFSKPKAPPPPPPAPPPPPPPAREDAMVKAETQADMLRRRKGRASTILTDDQSTSLGDGGATSAARVLGS